MSDFIQNEDISLVALDGDRIKAFLKSVHQGYSGFGKYAMLGSPVSFEYRGVRYKCTWNKAEQIMDDETRTKQMVLSGHLIGKEKI